MVEVPTTEELEGLQKQIDELKAAEESRVKAMRSQVQQTQQQLQNATAASINTMGQIEQLKDILKDQKRERHQLEGMLRAMVAQQQR